MLAALALAAASVATEPARCQRELVVLGAGQDAGAPQIGNVGDEGPDLWPSALALVDRENGQRYLFDATPAITAQLALLDRIEPPAQGLGIDGIFLTHAHIGHYLGLAWLGREAAGASGVPVYAMPRMAEFLRGNGPWSQLAELGNIALTKMAASEFTVLSDEFGVMPILVPHRDEYSETVGFFIMTPDQTALYVPDLDSWDEFAEASGQSLEDLVEGFDLLFLDATFWNDGELEGRDMSAIPHPRVKATMERLADLDAETRGKVHFIHYNHTNPIRDPASAESRAVEDSGFNVARRSDRFCLSE
ncbi:MBL fold metallo-hydrolase [Erythrobacter litoralis]|uniref:Coenzyme PQQ synthesis protein B n=1 Tax=Erythrobacter litoralis (strain HTCC2594) TaxID=314225 RepID=Q2N8C8_ERYLH|nr:MBL fold metallo-hydrolase [Erythrobacter litoralis]ABC64063.1 coenzyme PQQ synthesis protein B [Erythrobacter litoralis HTCC2594]